MTPPHSPALSDILIRFVTDGLIETIDSYQSGQLPLHRLNWELASRIDSLTDLAPTSKVATLLRWLHRDIDQLHTRCANTSRTNLTDTEDEFLAHTLSGMHRILTTLDPTGPNKCPSRPAGQATAVTTVGQRRGA
jgi:hypothetical protein